MTLVTGPIRGPVAFSIEPGGRLPVPKSIEQDPELQFNAKDQMAFGESLRTELVRLGVVKSASADASASKDLRIRVIFAETFHNPDSQVYVLNVAIELEGGTKPFRGKYRILSSERDTSWEKLNTNAYQGKEKAAKLLMEKVIVDIERYVTTS